MNGVYNIIYEHTMLVVGVFLFEELKTCSIIFQKRPKLHFPRTQDLYQTEYNFNAIFDKMLPSIVIRTVDIFEQNVIN